MAASAAATVRINKVKTWPARSPRKIENATRFILTASNINLVAFSIFLGDLTGQIFTLFILTVAAAEAAIGLAIIVVYYRNSGTIRVEEIDQLKG